MSARRQRPLVARVYELRTLADSARDASAGNSSMTIVRGEAGIGKSRLVQELCAAPPLSDLLLLRGECFRVDAGELPFAPLASALRDAGPEALATAMGELSRGAQAQLARIFPHLFAAAAEPALGADSDAHAQRQLFDALLCLLGTLGEDSAVLLVLEDLHWVDRSTSDFVRFLARSVRSERLATVLTYRTRTLPAWDPTERMINELVETRAAVAVDLGPLSADEIGDHARNLVGDPVGQTVLNRIHRRSQGNPYFAEELLAAHLAGHGDEVPAAIASAALPRVARVSAEAQLVLRHVAAVQRPVPWTLLERVCGLPADVLSDAVREALDHHLLTDDVHAGDFAFRHDLVREAVYGRLHAGERATLHLAVAEALTELGDGGHAELAFHWTRAGRRDVALAAHVQAGRDALAARAFAAAAGHFSAADRFCATADVLADTDALDRIDVLAHLADARQHAGDYPGAIDACGRALDALDPGRESARAAAFHERLGNLHSAKSEIALEHFRAALALLGPEDDAGRARLGAGEAYALWGLDRWSEACERAAEASEVADRAGAAAAGFYARVVLGLAAGSDGRRGEGERVLRDALAHEEGALPDDRLRAYLYLAEVCRMQGRLDEACQAMDDGAALAQTVGLRGVFGTYMTVNAASDLYHLGEWDEAEDRLERLRDLSLAEWTEIQLHQVAAQLTLARTTDLQAAANALDRAEALVPSAAPEFLPPIYAARAELVLAERGPREARAVVADGLEATADKAELLYTPLLYSIGARVEAEGAQLDRSQALRCVEAARRLLHALEAQIEAAGGDDPPPIALAHLATCRAETLRAQATAAGSRQSASRWKPAADAWAAAEDAWTAVSAPYPAAYARWRQADALLAGGGRRAEGTSSLRAAHAVAQRLGAQRLSYQIAVDAQRRGIALSPKRVTGPYGLTPRERAVLKLIGRGLRNEQIADELVITIRTAETHVGRVLRKLDVHSRVEASILAQGMEFADDLNRPA